MSFLVRFHHCWISAMAQPALLNCYRSISLLRAFPLLRANQRLGSNAYGNWWVCIICIMRISRVHTKRSLYLQLCTIRFSKARRVVGIDHTRECPFFGLENATDVSDLRLLPRDI